MNATDNCPVILPVNPENYPPTIPAFSSIEEARDFWDIHDSSYYWNQMETVADFRDQEPIPMEERPPTAEWLPKRSDASALKSLGFPDELITELRRYSVARKLSVPSLLRSWTIERLGQELVESDAGTELSKNAT